MLPLLCADPGFGVPLLGIKFLVARSPDPEIYFPAGTEMILRLVVSAYIPRPVFPQQEIAPLSAAEIAEVHRIFSQLPQQRTTSGHNHPSDLVNILFLGGGEPIGNAFQAAGWTGAQRGSMMSFYRTFHSVVQRMGYKMGPMGSLTLNGVTADAEYQKNLDTFSKRHHLRLWKQENGNIWLAAATEDTGYTVRRMHITHATDPFIDNERTKVLNDLAFTGCVEAASLVTRSSSDAGEEDRFAGTDGKVVAIRMNDCSNPVQMPSESAASRPRRERRPLQALVALRNDIIRSNPISLASNTMRILKQKEKSEVNGARSKANFVQSRWIRPSVLADENLTIAANR
jgi:hypothetical protein